ncbi:hypothetical protein JCM17380_34690 [Desulfosporosinus burensis]
MSELRYAGKQTRADILDKARILFSDKGYGALYLVYFHQQISKERSPLG